MSAAVASPQSSSMSSKIAEEDDGKGGEFQSTTPPPPSLSALGSKRDFSAIGLVSEFDPPPLHANKTSTSAAAVSAKKAAAEEGSLMKVVISELRVDVASRLLNSHLRDDLLGGDSSIAPSLLSSTTPASAKSAICSSDPIGWGRNGRDIHSISSRQ